MERKDILGDNRIEDVRWLCSLSESEIDFLISLKLLVLQRAKIIGHEDLAKKFDLKIIRALAFILMEHLKLQLEHTSIVPDLTSSSAFLDGCNLLRTKLNGGFDGTSIEELKSYIGSDQRKRIAEMFLDDVVLNQKKKK